MRLTAHDPIFDVKEAAEYLSMSEGRVRRLARTREIESIRTSNGSNVKFRLSALNRWVNNYTVRERRIQ